MQETWMWSVIQEIPHAVSNKACAPQLLSLCSRAGGCNSWVQELQLKPLHTLEPVLLQWEKSSQREAHAATRESPRSSEDEAQP